MICYLNPTRLSFRLRANHSTVIRSSGIIASSGTASSYWNGSATELHRLLLRRREDFRVKRARRARARPRRPTTCARRFMGSHGSLGLKVERGLLTRVEGL